MAQNAAQLLLRNAKPAETPATSQGFDEFFCAIFSASLTPILGCQVVLQARKNSTLRHATLRGQLQKPQLMAELPQLGGAMGYVFIAEGLARQVVAARLCATVGGKSLTAIDLALCSVLAEQAQLALARWHPTRPPATGPIQYGPLKLAPKADWQGFEFTIAVGPYRPTRLRLVLPVDLACRPAPMLDAATHIPAINPAVQACALHRATLPLRAVLHRQAMAGDRLADLRAGYVFELPPDCLNRLDIVLGDAQTTAIARARLGAFDGKKVLKLLDAPDAAQLRLVAE